ncbi:MAG: DNA photolyase [Deltaproteobacteria bacterium]|nr:DNA photolyase [Deltaproteobacteria bacterium]
MENDRVMPCYPIKETIVEEGALKSPMGRQILRRTPGRFSQKSFDAPVHNGMGKDALHLLNHNGEFLKPCPGTKEYICCGYQILNVATNCPLDCSYCILQSYFLNQPNLKIHVNLEENLAGILACIDKNPHQVFRVGTGEFADSLALDPIARWTDILMGPFSTRKNAVLEFKTKTTHIEGLTSSPHRNRIIVSWSLNSPLISATEEKGAATLKQRLEAARKCQSEGFVVSFHFDPLIAHENWREGYLKTIELMDRYLNPRGIIWISMGSLRFMPGLKPIIRKRHPRSIILNGEFIPGLDGKARYFKPIRMELFHFMREKLENWHRDTGLYLCMESDEIWRKTMGWSPGNSDGLKRFLDDRVRKIFG